jgi:iron complex transport system ATP-binding protein
MLDVSHIECGYGDSLILRGVSFRVEKGEMLGVIGPNGCGKTTLLRAISAVLPWRRGEVLLEGHRVDRIPRRDLARAVALVSQDIAADFPFDVREIVMMGRTPYISRFGWESRHDLEIAQQAMQFADVTHLADRPITDLSGGERQRAFIAMALAQQPRLLLLDEPTSHLDINHQVGVLDIIRDLNAREGVTVVMVSHDLNLAAEYCDRLLMLKDGQTAYLGTPDEVMTAPHIEEVYGLPVRMELNPVTGRPHVMLVPGNAVGNTR